MVPRPLRFAPVQKLPSGSPFFILREPHWRTGLSLSYLICKMEITALERSCKVLLCTVRPSVSVCFFPSEVIKSLTFGIQTARVWIPALGLVIVPIRIVNMCEVLRKCRVPGECSEFAAVYVCPRANPLSCIVWVLNLGTSQDGVPCQDNRSSGHL